MSEGQSEQQQAVEDWPTFALRYTFNPSGIGIRCGFEPDEVVVFDATRGDLEDSWLSATRGSYLLVEETR
jgi:hypothetical protein